MIKKDASEIRNLLSRWQLETAMAQLVALADDYCESKRIVAIGISAQYYQLVNEESVILSDAEIKNQKRIILHKALNLVNDIEQYKKTEIKPDNRKAANTSEQNPFNELNNENSREKPMVLYRCKNITKRYKSKFELGPIDLELIQGEITALIGTNGSGKSTLIQLISGRIKNSSGTFEYPDLNFNGEDWYELKRKIGYIPQRLNSWDGPLKQHIQYLLAINGILENENELRTDTVLHRLNLAPFANHRFHELSGGNQMRAALATLFALRPHLIILDEPLANLDIAAQQIFLGNIKELIQSEKYPTTMLISSQHLNEIEAIADNIIFLKNGQEYYNGPRKKFKENREYNVFEISCNVNLEDLQKCVLELNSRSKVKDSVVSFRIEVPVECSGSEVLKMLLQKKIEVYYFRDISQSTILNFIEP